MQIVGTILLVLGGIIACGGGIWFLVVAFQESIVWGLCCLFVPLLALVFLIIYWQKAWKPFVVELAGAVIVGIGVALTASQQIALQSQ